MPAPPLSLSSPAEAEGTRPLLRLRGVSKSFGATRALRNVDLDVAAGEIVGLVGENGAGKSTLVKVAAGVLPSSSFEGSVELDGADARFGSVADAEKGGVVLIPQELQVAAGLSIAENLLVGHLPTRWGLVDRMQLWRTASYWLTYFGMEQSPFSALSTLTVSEQRLVVIAGALSRQASLLILDEPTVALTTAEAERLFAHLRGLRDHGIGILYITHALDEVQQLADRVVVLRNGSVVARLDRGETTTRDQIVRSMLGRELTEIDRAQVHPTELTGAKPTLSTHEIRVFDRRVPDRAVVDGISLTLHEGEIVGAFGLVGSGVAEFAAAITGAWAGRVTGSMQLGTWRGLIRSPTDAIRRGLLLLTDDRQASGIFQGNSLSANVSASSLGRVTTFGLLRPSREYRRNSELVTRLHVICESLASPIDALSGGNQQKALLARALAAHPRVLILNEPTLGVDVGARVEIYRALQDLAAAGTSLLVVSSDVKEIATQCDRIFVIRKGRLVAERPGGADQHELLELAAGDHASAA
jgi:ABC-type sugar transport system ATPase subunit